MEVGQPSRTALATAFARAYHQIADGSKVFADPLAVRIAGVDPGELTAPDADETTKRRRRFFIAARSRFAEDSVADAIASGTRQVVILGAGLDTFAYRNQHPQVRVFEVDHPQTQAWKRQRLADAGIDIPASLTFTPVDFESQPLADGLAAVGFDRTAAAFFVWLGVVPYLTTETVITTLRFVASHAAPSQVVFDYGEPPSTMSPQRRAAHQARARRVADIGEPWLTFFTADRIENELLMIGFDEIEDLTGAGLLARYLGTAVSSSDAFGAHVLRAARTGPDD